MCPLCLNISIFLDPRREDCKFSRNQPLQFNFLLQFAEWKRQQYLSNYHSRISIDVLVLYFLGRLNHDFAPTWRIRQFSRKWRLRILLIICVTLEDLTVVRDCRILILMRGNVWHFVLNCHTFPVHSKHITTSDSTMSHLSENFCQTKFLSPSQNFVNFVRRSFVR